MIKPKSYKVLAGALMLFVLSCKVGPKYTQPEVSSPSQFRFDEEVAAKGDQDVNWWELFEDDVLSELVKKALENNKDVRIAISRLEQSRANLGYYRADIYPKLNAAAGVASGNYAGGLLQFENTQQVFYGNAQVAWELDFWGKFRRGSEAAKAEMMSSEYNLRSIQISLISEVVSSYFLLLDMHTRLEVSRKTLAVRDSGLQIITARFEKGIIPEIDVNQAQIQKSIAEAAVPLYKRQLAFAENNLNVLLGQNPEVISISSSLYDQNLPPEIPSGLPSELLQRRPDLLSSAEMLHAQTARIGVAQASRFPSFSLTGLLGGASSDLSTFGAEGLAWNASAGILSPVFHFNKNKRKVQIEREKTEQALLTYEKDVLRAFEEVENALVKVSTFKEELSARKDQRDAALNAEMLSFERYNKGVTSYLEVLENQRSLFQAELMHSQVYQELLSSYVELYKVLGGGWLSEEEKVASETNEP